ncbi:MAG TPA: hypothetical protein VGQ77_10210 [Methylomirabilota bacterium]|nr:hypothetical protein [Methylomirabilota bacterium]
MPASAGPPSFAFGPDTFAFRNEIRERHPGESGMYANYCFVLARGLRQFFQYARFDPEAPRVAHGVYVARVRAIAARPPWEGAFPPSERVVIPGYPHLRAFSAAEEAAVKEGLGGPVGTWFHWTNWRVTLPVSKNHQAEVADEVARELTRGRLVQLLVTNWPIVELNHTVVAYAYDDRADRIEFRVWDPNEIETPGIVTFDRLAQRFWATDVYATRPGPIRVFRMYHTPFL